MECGGGVGSGGMIIGDAMILFLSSRFEISVFEIKADVVEIPVAEDFVQPDIVIKRFLR